MTTNPLSKPLLNPVYGENNHYTTSALDIISSRSSTEKSVFDQAKEIFESKGYEASKGFLTNKLSRASEEKSTLDYVICLYALTHFSNMQADSILVPAEDIYVEKMHVLDPDGPWCSTPACVRYWGLICMFPTGFLSICCLVCYNRRYESSAKSEVEAAWQKASIHYQEASKFALAGIEEIKEITATDKSLEPSYSTHLSNFYYKLAVIESKNYFYVLSEKNPSILNKSIGYVEVSLNVDSTNHQAATFKSMLTSRQASNNVSQITRAINRANMTPLQSALT